MDDCIFCKIVSGAIPSVQIWQDEQHIAILDIHPNVKGMTLVIPRQHYPSHVFDMDEGAYTALLRAARSVALFLRKGLHTDRVGMGMDGTGVNHAHIKLFPLRREMGAELREDEERVYFDRFPGYITTQLGPMKTHAELEALAQEIKKNNQEPAPNGVFNNSNHYRQ